MRLIIVLLAAGVVSGCSAEPDSTTQVDPAITAQVRSIATSMPTPTGASGPAFASDADAAMVTEFHRQARALTTPGRSWNATTCAELGDRLDLVAPGPKLLESMVRVGDPYLRMTLTAERRAIGGYLAHCVGTEGAARVELSTAQQAVALAQDRLVAVGVRP